ncbi:hypothetical protein SESBI_47326 [Sesbania bispinosa]|nr:hypothetical protein SESBI_47326 [Sesbania bispinosa]
MCTSSSMSTTPERGVFVGELSSIKCSASGCHQNFRPCEPEEPPITTATHVIEHQPHHCPHEETVQDKVPLGVEGEDAKVHRESWVEDAEEGCGFGAKSFATRFDRNISQNKKKKP